MDKDFQANKNANDKVDALYKIWLGSMFWNITFIPLSDEDVQAIQDLLVGL